MRKRIPESYYEDIVRLALTPEWQSFMILLHNLQECCKEDLAVLDPRMSVDNLKARDDFYRGEYLAYKVLTRLGKEKDNVNVVRGFYNGLVTLERKIERTFAMWKKQNREKPKKEETTKFINSELLTR